MSLYHNNHNKLKNSLLNHLFHEVWQVEQNHQRHKWNKSDARAFSLASVSGSLSLEAAIVLPVLFSFFLLFIGLFLVIQQNTKIEWELCNEARLYSHSTDSVRSSLLLQTSMEQRCLNRKRIGSWYFGSSDLEAEDGKMDVRVFYSLRLPTDLLERQRYYMANRVNIHLWNGFDMTSDLSYVYITTKGEVYHTDKECTYIKPVITEVKAKDAVNMKNKNGEHYYHCKECCDDDDWNYGSGYITDYGVLFHRSEDCIYINHAILEIRMDEVGDRRLCSKCSKK